jgi:hypothetical protein
MCAAGPDLFSSLSFLLFSSQTFLRPLLEGKRKVDESDHESAPPPPPEADAAAAGGKNKLQSAPRPSLN